MKGEMDADWLQTGPGCREAKFAEILGDVDKRIAFRNRKKAMDIGLLLKHLEDLAQRHLDLRIVRPYGGRGHHVDCRAELVVNSVGQFADKGPSIQVGRMCHGGIGHDNLLYILYRIVYLPCIFLSADGAIRAGRLR